MSERAERESYWLVDLTLTTRKASENGRQEERQAGKARQPTFRFGALSGSRPSINRQRIRESLLSLSLSLSLSLTISRHSLLFL